MLDILATIGIVVVSSYVSVVQHFRSSLCALVMWMRRVRCEQLEAVWCWEVKFWFSFLPSYEGMIVATYVYTYSRATRSPTRTLSVQLRYF